MAAATAHGGIRRLGGATEAQARRIIPPQQRFHPPPLEPAAYRMLDETPRVSATGKAQSPLVCCRALGSSPCSVGLTRTSDTFVGLPPSSRRVAYHRSSGRRAGRIQALSSLLTGRQTPAEHGPEVEAAARSSAARPFSCALPRQRSGISEWTSD